MIRDSLQLVDDIIKLIEVPAITSQITGKIWADERWDDSSKTDIVVNSTGIINRAIQVGAANINIYVPSESQTWGGKTKLYPNRKEMKRLAALVSPLVETQWKETFHCEIEEAGRIAQDADGSWYINITVKYWSLQEKYKNI